MSSPRCLQHVYQSFCTLISLLLNSFLIYLIINKSPKKLGDYKWLMIYTAVFEQVYTLVDLLTEPTAYSYGHSFVVFRRYNATWTNAEESQVLILAWCGLFGSSMAVFGVHFVYRFASVHAGTSLLCNKMKSIGKNVLVLFAVPVFYGAWWTIVCIVYCRYTPGTYQYMKNMTKTLYNLNIEDISYISAVFYIDDPVDESIHLNFGSWIALCQFSTMVGSSMFCVGYLGYRCYSELSGQLSMTSNQSQLATSLQKQLYFALVGQTVIPIAFMYLPICVFVFGPVFMVEIGVVSTFLTHFVTLYPVLDPLPNMFIIKTYRNAIMEIWRRIKSGSLCSSHKHQITVETVTSVGTTMRQYNGSVIF
uniref:Seven TM Receptor n=1 Tax=Caenorhabditis tropicalis TaxID=1561998 RepID=A0A1I7SXT1_9PELO